MAPVTLLLNVSLCWDLHYYAKVHCKIEDNTYYPKPEEVEHDVITCKVLDNLIELY